MNDEKHIITGIEKGTINKRGEDRNERKKEKKGKRQRERKTEKS